MGDRVYAVILAIVRNPITAEDLTQDTFIRVWNHSDQFAGDIDALRRWLLAIGRHRAIDFLRQMKRRVEKDSVPMDGADEKFAAGPERGPLRRADPGDVLSIRYAILRLPKQQRAVIELAYWEGLSQTEIAEQLNQPLGTVKGWTRSALKHLRTCMEEQPGARSRENLDNRQGSLQ
ncbi:MAG: sigma-70 family RNA polymerase sigma factor [Acidobacteriota bacterium]|nr:sigma-70 family RNA polymerase sigma factor [Acidobacteriota bacterium]